LGRTCAINIPRKTTQALSNQSRKMRIISLGETMISVQESAVPFDDILRDLTPSLKFLDQIHNLVAICVGDEIVYLNPCGATLLGLDDTQAALNRSFFSFVHNDYSELADIGISLFAEEDSAISMKLVGEDGTDIDVELWVKNLDRDNVYILEAHDMTDHLRAARALRLREQRLEGIINTVADGIVTVDDEGIIQTFNPAAESIFGFSKIEVVGRNIRSLIPGALLDDPNSESGDQSSKQGTAINITGKRKSGDAIDLEMAIRTLQQGEQLSFTGIMRDVTTRKADEARIFHMAHHDALTGLPNRHLFTDRVDEALKRANRYRQRFALIFVDLDKFKPINDSYGHTAGDEVLKEVASRLKRGVRSTDTVARMGGDEFVILFENMSSSDEIEELQRKIKILLAEPLRLSAVTLKISASLGVGIYPDHADNIEDLMNFADHEMYRAKQQG
jgi:diguanylate cyclase (GGDEF)-like protein/PAS domain S-box-containing protein